MTDNDDDAANIPEEELKGKWIKNVTDENQSQTFRAEKT